jgi:hypothetical protein
MLPMLIIIALILQETVQPPMIVKPDNWFEYGLAGALIFLMGLLLKYIIQRDQNDKEREAKLALQRSEMYREDNKVRDERWIKTLESLAKILENIDKDGCRFIDATNTTIEKFIQLVDKVMDQANYQTQVLTELKTIVQKLPGEFQLEKKEIIEHLDKLVMNLELKKRIADER